jgi:uncharacterized cupredoxin-like copper-binding protein
MRQRTIPSTAALAAVAITTLAPAGLAAASAPHPAHAAATTISVTGREFSFKLSKTSIPKPGTVTFSFRNAGTTAHDFRIGGKQTPMTRPGKTARLKVTFHKKGRFTYICTVPGHAAAGMKGVFTVR